MLRAAVFAARRRQVFSASSVPKMPHCTTGPEPVVSCSTALATARLETMGHVQYNVGQMSHDFCRILRNSPATSDYFTGLYHRSYSESPEKTDARQKKLQ